MNSTLDRQLAMRTIVADACSIVIIDPASAQHLIGNRCIYEGREIELVAVKRNCAVVKATDGSGSWKIPWSKLMAEN